MTPAQPAISQNPDDPPLVDDVWEDVLVAYGFDRSRAEQIVRLTLSMPELTMDHPDSERVREALAAELDELDFESEVGEDSADLRSVLLEVLDLGLADDIVGPTGPPAEIAYGGPSSAAAGYRSVAQTLSDAGVEIPGLDWTTLPGGGGDASDDGPGSLNAETEAAPTPASPDHPDVPDSLGSSGFEKKVFNHGIGEDADPESDRSPDDVEVLIGFLHDALEDSNPEVRERAAEAIGSLAGTDVRADKQLQTLYDRFGEEADPAVKAAIVGAVEAFLLVELGGEGDVADDSTDTDPRDATTGLFSDSRTDEE